MQVMSRCVGLLKFILHELSTYLAEELKGKVYSNNKCLHT